MVTLTTSDKDQAKLINNRQNGRRRGRGGQQVRTGQPGNQDRGNRIDNRARGNAAQLLEKYKSMARDAQMQGDRVNTEYYLQFADHYFRVLSESRARFEEQRPNEPRQPRQEYRDEFGQDGGDDDGDGDGQRFEQDGNWSDGEDERQQPQQRQPEPRQSEPRQSEPRQSEPRQSEPRQSEPKTREPRQPERRPTMQPRFEEQSPAANAGDGDERASQPRLDGERRPRRQNSRANGGNGNGNGHDVPGDFAGEGVPERIEIDRLPQSLTSVPTGNEAEALEGEEAPRPRRRAPRRPRSEASPVEI